MFIRDSRDAYRVHMGFCALCYLKLDGGMKNECKSCKKEIKSPEYLDYLDKLTGSDWVFCSDDCIMRLYEENRELIDFYLKYATRHRYDLESIRGIRE